MAIPRVLKESGFLTTTEAAIIVGVHRATIWNAIQQKHLRSRLIGNSMALSVKDVENYRDNWRRGEVTSTSRSPAKKGRPLLPATVRRRAAEAAKIAAEAEAKVKAAKAAKKKAARAAKAAEEDLQNEAVALSRCAPVLDATFADEVMQRSPWYGAPLSESTAGPTMTNCSKCSGEIPDNEAQMCTACGADGLGNCCIGVDDHVCARIPDEDGE